MSHGRRRSPLLMTPPPRETGHLPSEAGEEEECHSPSIALASTLRCTSDEPP